MSGNSWLAIANFTYSITHYSHISQLESHAYSVINFICLDLLCDVAIIISVHGYFSNHLS